MRVIVIGGGHNGLVAACYLARAGQHVLVLEQSDRLGGGSRTEELVRGYRFNTHSAAHNIINATDIVDDLRLRDVGLEYREMDPFSVAVFGDGRIVRFHRDVERTVASIAEVDVDESRRYREWMRDAMPVVTAFRAGLDTGAGAWTNTRRLPGRALAAAAALRRNGGPLGLARLLLSPHGRLLRERFASDLVRGPVSAFAAHASASPNQPGSALFALWQAFYHQVGQWHAVGGSQGPTDALAHRLTASGGEWRTGAPVTRITCRDGRTTGVELEDDEHLPADAVVTAIDPRTALLDLLDPPLADAEAARLRAAHSGNAVQMLVLLATTQLPAYPGARPGDHTGLQSYVDTLDSLAAGFARAEARQLPHDPVPTYSFTPSALDPALRGRRRLGRRRGRVRRPHDRHGRGARPRLPRQDRRARGTHTRDAGARAALAGRPPHVPRCQPRPARAAATLTRARWAPYARPGPVRVGRGHRTGRRHLRGAGPGRGPGPAAHAGLRVGDSSGGMGSPRTSTRLSRQWWLLDVREDPSAARRHGRPTPRTSRRTVPAPPWGRPSPARPPRSRAVCGLSAPRPARGGRCCRSGWRS